MPQIPSCIAECSYRELDPQDIYICKSADSDLQGRECKNDKKFPEGCPYYSENFPRAFRFTSKYGEPH